MDYRSDIREYLACEIETLRKLDIESINAAVNLLHDTWEQRRCVYVFGNGGSSATASHFQNDFNKGISEHIENKFRFVCLNDNVPTVMAIANDIGFDEVFRFQLRGQMETGDIAIAISGSGNSKNVLNGAEHAKSCGNKVIALTGFDGGQLARICDISLNVPVASMQVTEDVHMLFDHLMMSMFYKHLCGKNHLRSS